MERMTQPPEPTVTAPVVPGPAAAPASAPKVDKIVVAAVIERDGLFLAARRTEPPELAGLWEFPGGKVEPGEDEASALVRECREELGVEVAVGAKVGPDYLTPSGTMLVRTYRATLLDGEPAPIESHDELRWLAAGTPEVRALPWLDGDYVILDTLDNEENSGTRVA
jgi:8-oxo-dGTP diphosphatase